MVFTFAFSYCALWAYVSCHVSTVCYSGNSKSRQSNALFLIVGNWRRLHFATAALPGCGFGYTSVRRLRSLVLEVDLTYKRHCRCRWTLVHDTLVSDTLASKIEKRGGKREKKRASWVGEKKTSDIGGNK